MAWTANEQKSMINTTTKRETVYYSYGESNRIDFKFTESPTYMVYALTVFNGSDTLNTCNSRVIACSIQLKVVIDSNAKLIAYEKGADFTLVSVVEAVGDNLTVVSCTDVLCQRNSCVIM